MSLIDMRTVIVGYALTNLICLMVMAVLWKHNRGRFAGLGLCLADYALQFLALALLALRGVAPDLVSMTGSNAMAIGGTILIFVGLERFAGIRGPQLRNGVLLGAFVAVHAYFVLALPSLTARNVLFSLALLLICLQCARLLLRRVGPEMRPVTRGVGYVFVGFCLVSILRIGLDLAWRSGTDLFRSHAHDTLAILIYQMLFITLTFSLFLMVNRRLIAELERDIATRAEMERELKSSEEKFSKAFQASPEAIVISRLDDGRLIEVNESFCRLTGYTRDEALASSPTGLGLWAKPADREAVVGDLRSQRRVRDREYDFRAKSGRAVGCLYSGEVIHLGDQAHVLSVVSDITDRKRAEAVIRLRLRLWECAASHPVAEVMQRALDEIEELTGSLIGFYHFVEEDQNTLSLQAWSTRTLGEFCKAEGNGLHYPISEAGVWVDCVHQRKPVIHNDYLALPHRKGMPEGHAQVVRELVVPTLRGGRVVSVLGVGNKPSEYDGRDVELVSYIADMVWVIVERRRADEEIRRLNGELERMAMTDELTSLRNRRFFFAQGDEEIKRSRRYQTPLSMIMLDIDGFKAINDTQGHSAGDLMLKCVAATLLGKSREIDVVARLGGEEFGVLLPNTAGADAVKLAERLRLAIENTKCPIRDLEVGVTVSVGVATQGQEVTGLDALLRNADAAMYQAKREGRNRVAYLG